MQTDFLKDDRFRVSQKKDLAMLSNAVRRFGNRLRDAGPEIVDRMMDIVNKTSVSVVTEDGDVVDSESAADENSMRASEILGKLIAIEQKDDHHADKLASPKQSPSIAIQVNNGGTLAANTDAGQSENPDAVRGRVAAIFERFRLVHDAELSAGGHPPSDDRGA